MEEGRGIHPIYSTLVGDLELITVFLIPDSSCRRIICIIDHVLDLYLDSTLSDNSSPSPILLTFIMNASTRKVKIHRAFAPHSHGNKVLMALILHSRYFYPSI
jgi:hypothetical protein